MKKKIFYRLIPVILTILVMFSTSVCAANNTGSDYDWWGGATAWYNNGSTTVGLSSGVLSSLSTMVEIVGTAVIAIAAVVIGIKYMLGTVQGKVEAKENLITLLVACLFFFGWSSIRGILIAGNSTAENGLSGNTYLKVFSGGDYTSTFASIFTFLVIVGKFITVAAILYMGVRYIFAGADAKAKLKETSPAMIIGIVLIFCTTTVLGVVANVINETLN